MFGKRAGRPSSADNEFPEDEFEQSAQADMAEATDEWAGDDTDVDAQPVRKGGSGLGKLVPFVALGLIAAGGAGFFYVKYLAPKQNQTATSEVIAAAPEQTTAVAMADPEAETLPTETTDELTAAAPEVAPVALPQDGAVAEADPLAAPAPVELTQEAPADQAVPADATEMAAAPIAEQEQPALVDVTDTAVAQAAPADPVVEAMPMAEATPDTDSAPVPEEATAVADPALEALAPVESPVEAPVEAPVVVAPVVAQQDSVPVSTPSTADAPSGDVGMRLSVVEHQMADVAKAVDTLVAKQSAQSGADMATQLTALESQVKSLQAELRELRAAPRQSAKAEPAAKVESKPAAAAVPNSEKPTKASSTADSKPAAAAAAKATWVLRAAQSGEAWVSRGAQGSLQSVKVGDSLPGIGRISAITQRDGVWVVVGTVGSLRQ